MRLKKRHAHRIGLGLSGPRLCFWPEILDLGDDYGGSGGALRVKGGAREAEGGRGGWRGLMRG